MLCKHVLLIQIQKCLLNSIEKTKPKPSLSHFCNLVTFHTRPLCTCRSIQRRASCFIFECSPPPPKKSPKTPDSSSKVYFTILYNGNPERKCECTACVLDLSCINRIKLGVVLIIKAIFICK